MHGYVVFAESRWAALSDAEGRYTLELPAGAYKLEAWHEHLGVRTVDVVVEEGKSVAPEIKFKWIPPPPPPDAGP